MNRATAEKTPPQVLERESGSMTEQTEAEVNDQGNTVKMTVTLPRNVAAFLRWKAEVDGMKRDELLRRIIVHYAKKLREQDFRTPPVED
jgi:hypothetical protein